MFCDDLVADDFVPEDRMMPMDYALEDHRLVA